MFTPLFKYAAVTLNVTSASPNICVEEDAYLSLNDRLHNRENGYHNTWKFACTKVNVKQCMIYHTAFFSTADFNASIYVRENEVK